MPAIGTTKLSKQTKAKILAEKRVGTGTSRDIANKYGVAVQTVRNLDSADRPASPEVRVMAATLQTRILEKAKTNLESGIEEIGRRITDPDERLTSIVLAARFCFEVYRGIAEMADPTAEAAAKLIEVIRARAEQEGVSFESELETYLANFAHVIHPDVRARLEMVRAGGIAVAFRIT